MLSPKYFSRDHGIGDTIPACIRDHQYPHRVLEPYSFMLQIGPREYGTGRQNSFVKLRMRTSVRTWQGGL